jgi:hypothetical protein
MKDVPNAQQFGKLDTQSALGVEMKQYIGDSSKVHTLQELHICFLNQINQNPTDFVKYY